MRSLREIRAASFIQATSALVIACRAKMAVRSLQRHDSVVHQIADRIAVMYLGCFVEEAPAETLFTALLHPYTQSLTKAVPLPDPSALRYPAELRGDMPSALLRVTKEKREPAIAGQRIGQ